MPLSSSAAAAADAVADGGGDDDGRRRRRHRRLLCSLVLQVQDRVDANTGLDRILYDAAEKHYREVGRGERVVCARTPCRLSSRSCFLFFFAFPLVLTVEYGVVWRHGGRS